MFYKNIFQNNLKKKKDFEVDFPLDLQYIYWSGIIYVSKTYYK